MSVEADILEAFSNSIILPDRRDIVRWTEEEVILPSPPYSISGPVDLSLSPYLREPLLSLQSDEVRTVVCAATPRTGKTLLSELFLLYCLKQDPADILIAFHTRDVLKAFYDVRLLKLLQANDVIPDTAERFDTTQKLIRLPKSTVRMVSVNNANSLTALGVRVAIGDECAKYKPGMIAQIKGRCNDYRYSKKQLFISQASEEGHEFHVEWKQGQQASYGFKCPQCNTVQKFDLAVKRKDNTYGGLNWDTNEITKPRGIRDIPKTLETVRYNCIHCRQAFYDTERDRRALTKAGLYIVQNPSANPEVRSYQWNALACPTYSFKEIASAYLIAKHEFKRSKKEKFKNFFMQEMATFWGDHIGMDKYQLKVGVAEDGEAKADAIRVTGVDVQQGGNLLYFVIVEYHKVLKTIKVIHHGKTDGFESLDKINKQHQVKDQNVLVDAGDGNYTRLIYRACATHGHTDAKGRYFCWTATHGSGEAEFVNPTTKKSTFFSRPKYQDANVGLAGKKLYCPYVTFSANTAKDILKSLLDATHPDFKLYMSEAAAADENFKEQLHNEQKVVKNGKPTWVPVKEHAENHYFDALVLTVVAGGIMGFL